MFQLIHKMHIVLNSIKGIITGYSSSNHESMIISYDGKVYRIDITEIDEGEATHEHLKSL